MLQFQPQVLINIELEYLSLKELIELAATPPLSEEAEREMADFRASIQTLLKNHLEKLEKANVRIIREPGDEVYLILARTINELEREKAELLFSFFKNKNITEVHQKALHNLNPQNSIDEVIKLDAQLNIINMALAQPDLPDNLEETGLYFSCTGLTRLPEALMAKLLEYKKLTYLYLGLNYLTNLPESFGNLITLESLDLNSNQLSTLPESFGNLTALESLLLLNNPITMLPESVRPILEKVRIQPTAESNQQYLSLIQTPAPLEPPMPAAAQPITHAFEAKREAKVKSAPKAIPTPPMSKTLAMQSSTNSSSSSSSSAPPPSVEALSPPLAARKSKKSYRGKIILKLNSDSSKAVIHIPRRKSQNKK